jgi:hypothetical protein
MLEKLINEYLILIKVSKFPTKIYISTREFKVLCEEIDKDLTISRLYNMDIILTQKGIIRFE